MGLAFFFFNNRFGRFLSPSFQLSKDDFIPKCFLSLQNVLATHPPPHHMLNCLFCILQFILNGKLMASLVLSHWNKGGPISNYT